MEIHTGTLGAQNSLESRLSSRLTTEPPASDDQLDGKFDTKMSAGHQETALMTDCGVRNGDQEYAGEALRGRAKRR